MPPWNYQKLLSYISIFFCFFLLSLSRLKDFTYLWRRLKSTGIIIIVLRVVENWKGSCGALGGDSTQIAGRSSAYQGRRSHGCRAMRGESMPKHWTSSPVGHSLEPRPNIHFYLPVETFYAAWECDIDWLMDRCYQNTIKGLYWLILRL